MAHDRVCLLPHMRVVARFWCALAVFGSLISIAAVGQSSASQLEARQAGSVGVRVLTDQSGARARLSYQAAPGARDSLIIALDWDPRPSVFSALPEPPSAPIAFAVLVPGPDDLVTDETCASVPPSLDLSCGIPSGAHPLGPLVRLGDRSDNLSVGFSRRGTEIFGGPGDDTIRASGDIYGGAGNDEIEGRVLGRSNIRGGPGNDRIIGGRRGDVIDPGPGEDSVRNSPEYSRARDVIRTRDSNIDGIVCGQGTTALIDGLDYYPEDCGRVERVGVARALPIYYEHGGVGVDCAPDGPRICAGSIRISAPGIRLQREFRMPRGDHGNSNFEHFEFDLSPRQLLVLDEERVRITVRTRFPKARTLQATTTQLPLL